MMIRDNHELFSKIFKMNLSVFHSTESKDAYDFIIDCHERLYKMDVVEMYYVELVTFQFLGVAKMWWKAYVECRATSLTLLTWTKFYSIFKKSMCLIY